MTADRAALVERMAEAFFDSLGEYNWPAIQGEPQRRIRHQLSAALDLALEEAAKVAEGFPAHTHGNLATAPPQAAEQAADEIAAAIRALKSRAS